MDYITICHVDILEPINQNLSAFELQKAIYGCVIASRHTSTECYISLDVARSSMFEDYSNLLNTLHSLGHRSVTLYANTSLIKLYVYDTNTLYTFEVAEIKHLF
ncbi:hypothetical protein [Capybara microvirus Cap1_SP_61]|nr:hypothetical protein [Capybara microvirus Cap1_SP_61]